MEIPNIGAQCSFKECKQLDFLPFKCEHCGEVFCKEHFGTDFHSCSKVGVEKNQIKTIGASKDCGIHPFDEAMMQREQAFKKEDLSKEQLQSQFLESIKKSKEDFKQIKKSVDKDIDKKLKSSKNTAIASKIQLMKLKGKAVGLKSIPMSERCYFQVHLPLNVPVKIDSSVPKAFFVSSEWSISRIIDYISNELNIPNHNNVTTAKKLRLFHHDTGEILSKDFGEILSGFIKASCLINGDDIILEYSDDERIESSLYK